MFTQYRFWNGELETDYCEMLFVDASVKKKKKWKKQEWAAEKTDMQHNCTEASPN